MAEAVATPEERFISRQLAREKLQALKAGRRARAEVDYFGPGGKSTARSVGADYVDDFPQSPVAAIEENERLDQFRENVGARSQRFGQIKALRAARAGNQTAQQVEDTAQAAASAFAKQAYTRVWQLAEEGIEDFAFSFLDLMLISGPAAVIMFFTRLFGGNIFGGMGTVTFRGVSIPRVPGYSVPEGTYRFGKIVLIGLISGLIYATILFVIYVLTHPEFLVLSWLCTVFGGLVSYIGISTCTL